MTSLHTRMIDSIAVQPASRVRAICIPAMAKGLGSFELGSPDVQRRAYFACAANDQDRLEGRKPA